MYVNRSFMLRCEELISKAARPWLPRASADVQPCVLTFVAALRAPIPCCVPRCSSYKSCPSQMSNPDKGWF